MVHIGPQSVTGEAGTLYLVHMKLWIILTKMEVEYLADVVKRVVLSLGKGGTSSAAGWEGLQLYNIVYIVQSLPCLVTKPPTHCLF